MIVELKCNAKMHQDVAHEFVPGLIRYQVQEGINIIDDPSLTGRLRTFVEFLLTIFIWYWFINASLPFLFAVVSLFYKDFDEVFSVDSIYFDEIAPVTRYAIVIACIFLVMLTWIIYNKLWFGHFSRRKAVRAVSSKELADFFDVSESEVVQLQNQKEVIWDREYVRRV